MLIRLTIEYDDEWPLGIPTDSQYYSFYMQAVASMKLGQRHVTMVDISREVPGSKRLKQFAHFPLPKGRP